MAIAIEVEIAKRCQIFCPINHDNSASRIQTELQLYLSLNQRLVVQRERTTHRNRRRAIALYSLPAPPPPQPPSRVFPHGPSQLPSSARQSIA